MHRSLFVLSSGDLFVITNGIREFNAQHYGENFQQTTYWNIFSYFFPGNRFWHFMQIVSNCLRVHMSFCKFCHAVAKITYEHDTNEHRHIQQIQQFDWCAQRRLRSVWTSSRRSAWKYLEISAIQKAYSKDWSHWADALADLSFSWTYRSNCHAQAQLEQNTTEHAQSMAYNRKSQRSLLIALLSDGRIDRRSHFAKKSCSKFD